MHFKWKVPDIQEEDRQSGLVTMEDIWKFHTRPKLKQTERNRKPGVLPIDACILYLRCYRFSLMKTQI